MHACEQSKRSITINSRACMHARRPLAGWRARAAAGGAGRAGLLGGQLRLHPARPAGVAYARGAAHGARALSACLFLEVALLQPALVVSDMDILMHADTCGSWRTTQDAAVCVHDGLQVVLWHAWCAPPGPRP